MKAEISSPPPPPTTIDANCNKQSTHLFIPPIKIHQQTLQNLYKNPKEYVGLMVHLN